MHPGSGCECSVRPGKRSPGCRRSDRGPAPAWPLPAEVTAELSVSEFQTAIAEAHPEVPVHIYEASGHGFNNDGRPDSDPGDARLARERTLALFQAHGAA